MQDEITQILSSLTEVLGLNDPISLGVYLAAPGAIMFVVIFFGRELFRPRWRGYWDAV